MAKRSKKQKKAGKSTVSSKSMKDKAEKKVKELIKDEYPDGFVEVELANESVEHINHLAVDFNTFEYSVVENHELSIKIDDENKDLLYFYDQFEDLHKGDLDHSINSCEETIYDMFELDQKDSSIKTMSGGAENEKGVLTAKIVLLFPPKPKIKTPKLQVIMNRSTGRVIEIINTVPGIPKTYVEPDKLEENIKEYVERLTIINSDFENFTGEVYIEPKKTSEDEEKVTEYKAIRRISSPFRLEYLKDTGELVSWYFRKREFGGKEVKLPYEDVKTAILDRISLPTDAVLGSISSSDGEAGKSPAYMGTWNHITDDGWKVDFDQLRVAINAHTKKIYSYVKFWTKV